MPVWAISAQPVGSRWPDEGSQRLSFVRRPRREKARARPCARDGLTLEVDRDEPSRRDAGERVLARLRRADEERQLLLLVLAGKFASRRKTRVAVPSFPVSSSAGMLNWLYGTAVT